MSAVGKSTQLYSAFDPRTLGGCALWLDGADTNSMVLSGSNVTQWNDKSGNARNTSAVVGTPVLSNRSDSGKQGVYFNGSSHFTGAFAYSSNTLSWFVVGTVDGGTYGRLLSFSDSNQLDYDSTTRLVALARDSTTNSVIIARLGNIGTGMSITVSTPFFVSSVIDGTSNAPFLNGTAATGAATSGNFGFSRYGISSSAGTNSTERNTGFIFETIVFSNALSTVQRQQVEGYLSRKWGVSPPQSSVSLGNPLSVPGCTLWLDAADSNAFTFSTGSNISQWRDKSGSNFHATASGSPVYDATNRRVVFNGSAQYMSNLSFPFNLAQRTLFFVVQDVSSDTFAAFMTFVPTPSSGTDHQSTSGLVFESWSNGLELYANSAGYNPRFASKFAPRAMYTEVFSPSNGTVYVNGQTATTANANFSFGTCSGYGLSMRWISGAITSPYFNGYHHEVLIYNRALSTSERQQVEGYLESKWGLALSNSMTLPTTHPYRLAPPMLRPFTPLDISGCSLWLDGADRTTMTLSGTGVSSWRDKSPNAFTASGSNLPGYSATALDGRPGITFNGSTQYFDLGNVLNLTSNQLFAFVVCKFNSTANGAVLGKSLAGGAVGRYSLLRESGVLFPLIQTSTTVNSSGFSDSSTAVRLLNVAWNRSTLQLYENGTSRYSTALADATSFSNAYNFLIGAYQSGSGGLPPFAGFYLNGVISEVVLFLGTLTSADRQRVEAYLAQKWGFSAPPSSVSLGNPLSIPGCGLWLDAGDSSTFDLSGTGITAWRDKSSNAYTASGSNLPGYSTTALNSRPGVTFNGTSQYFNVGNVLNLGSNQLYMFVVHQFNSTANGALAGKTLFGSATGRYALWRDSGQLRPLIQGTSVNNAGYADTSTATRISSMTWNRSTVQLFENGTSQFSVALADTTSYSNSYLFLVGAYPSGTGDLPPTAGYYLNGTISEILVYLAPLTTTQRGQIEAYLSGKWGIAVSSNYLPSGHIGRIAPAMSAQFVPTSISNCAVWYDAADPTTVTVTGGVVTGVADKSGNARNLSNGTGFTYNVTKFNGTYPSFYNSTVNASFIGSNASISLSQPVTIFAVGQTESTSNTFPFIADSTNSGSRIAVYFWNSNTFRTRLFSGSTEIENVNGPATFVNSYIANTSSSQIFGNGTSIASGSIGTGTFSGLVFGNSFGVSTSGWAGHLCEFLIYSGVLSTADRQRVEGYLSRKWGFPGPSLSISPIIASPLSISGCTLWLDAADSSTFTFSSGSNVSLWNDKSGTSNHLSNVGAAGVTASNSTVTYDGTSWLQRTGMTIPQTFTFFAVARKASGNGPLFTNNTTTGGISGFFPNYSAQYFLAQSDGVWATAVGSSFSDGTTYLYSIVYTSTSNLTLRSNGAPYVTTTQTGTITRNSVLLGKRNAGGFTENWVGTFMEILQYSNTPTTAQRQQIETYLANKWGITIAPNFSLPSTHPYKMTPLL
jgi:hypothetical protein